MKVLNFNDPYVDSKGNVNNLEDVLSDISVDLTDYAKKTDIPTSLPANGGNADTVNNHTVESNVPENAVFTDTIYDDTTVKGSIDKLNSNLSNKTKLSLELGDIKWVDGGNIESTTWKRSGFIKVTPNTKYTLNRTQTESMNIIGYKEDKTVITDGNKPTSAIIQGVKTAEYEFTTTPTTNYIRIAITDTDLSENITLTNNGIGNTVIELVEDVAEIKNYLTPIFIQKQILESDWSADGNVYRTQLTLTDDIPTNKKVLSLYQARTYNGDEQSWLGGIIVNNNNLGTKLVVFSTTKINCTLGFQVVLI